MLFVGLYAYNMQIYSMSTFEPHKQISKHEKCNIWLTQNVRYLDSAKLCRQNPKIVIPNLISVCKYNAHHLRTKCGFDTGSALHHIQGQKFMTKCESPFGFSKWNLARIHGFSPYDLVWETERVMRIHYENLCENRLSPNFWPSYFYWGHLSALHITVNPWYHFAKQFLFVNTNMLFHPPPPPTCPSTGK